MKTPARLLRVIRHSSSLHSFIIRPATWPLRYTVSSSVSCRVTPLSSIGSRNCERLSHNRKSGPCYTSATPINSGCFIKTYKFCSCTVQARDFWMRKTNKRATPIYGRWLSLHLIIHSSTNIPFQKGREEAGLWDRHAIFVCALVVPLEPDDQLQWKVLDHHAITEHHNF
jgi:hypothetical protein